MAQPEGIYNVSLDLYGIEATDENEALVLFLQQFDINPPSGTLFVVTDDETGAEHEIDYRRNA